MSSPILSLELVELAAHRAAAKFLNSSNEHAMLKVLAHELHKVQCERREYETQHPEATQLTPSRSTATVIQKTFSNHTGSSGTAESNNK